jgi:23S rRNA U2552 (ribose-2'-O)-methylase RlmE/FtsJ
MDNSKIFFNFNNMWNRYKNNNIIGYTSDKFNYNIIKNKNLELKNILNFQKEKITLYDINNVWDSYKKHTNIYEAVYSQNLYSQKTWMANINPLSRSYFKMHEIIHDYDLCSKKKILKICCLAEGPGGFIEALIKERHNLGYKEDKLYAMTLKSVNRNIPGWRKAKNFLNRYSKQIVINYGLDSTGNIYYPNNLEFLYNSVIKDSCDIITSDGGFDFSKDFNNQEELCFRLLLSEIYGAILMQSDEGTFICKFYDCFTEKSVLLIYILSLMYKNVDIIKPYTSRPANSEKYVICRNFQKKKNLIFINEIKSSLRKILLQYKKYENSIGNILKVQIPNDFYYRIFQLNKYFVNKQILSINRALLYISLHNIDIDKNLLNNIKKQFVKEQIESSKKWCLHYNVKIRN